MKSGIVPFHEIIEHIKDATGIKNLRPSYDMVRRFIFKVEEDIGAGGMMIRKKKTYTLDTNYSGKFIVLPEDFVREYFLGSLTNLDIVGNILTLTCEMQDLESIDLDYVGFILDNEGNPFTNRNSLEAIIQYFLYRTYSAKLYLNQKGVSHRLYKDYQAEYEDEVLNARGKIVYPSEEEYRTIGQTLKMSTIELIAQENCETGIFEELIVCDETVSVGTPEPETTLVYYWQYDSLTADITDIQALTQDTLEAKDSDTIAIFTEGKSIEYSAVGRIAFAIQVSTEDQYKIYDLLDNDITAQFNTNYDSTLEIMGYISIDNVAHGTVLFKIK